MRTTDKTWKEILSSLIEIAEKNGFENIPELNLSDLVQGTNYYSLIFRHDFAKSLWGEEEAYTNLMKEYTKKQEEGLKVDFSLIPPPVWNRNLEALVTSEDKYLFLESFLNKLENGSLNNKPDPDEMDARRAALVSMLGDKFKKK